MLTIAGGIILAVLIIRYWDIALGLGIIAVLLAGAVILYILFPDQATAIAIVAVVLFLGSAAWEKIPERWKAKLRS